ncbi:MAG: DUF2958 domain-containing protein [Chloroflexi bacterium]|nr:DUF2958 domain-containing protein [Chloroflexota bacterium]
MNVPQRYATEKQDAPLAIIRLFTPDSSWTWYITEYDGDDTLFGLVVGMETEIGYISLSELQSVTGPRGLRIERDLWFKPVPITEVPDYVEKWGHAGPYNQGAAR